MLFNSFDQQGKGNLDPHSKIPEVLVLELAMSRLQEPNPVPVLHPQPLLGLCSLISGLPLALLPLFCWNSLNYSLLQQD